MSASLVGSEMCIRDSFTASRDLPGQSWAGLGNAWAVPRRCLGGARAVPVSYTHLTLPTICSV
eukprot:3469611-Alexandrium_andersonii.AAC.1